MKKKIVFSIGILAMLVFVYWWGGNSPALRGWEPSGTQTSLVMQTPEPIKTHVAEEITSEPETTPEPPVSDRTTEPDLLPSETEPEATPPPVTPEVDTKTDELICTLSVRCDTILNNISWLEEEKIGIVPKDGVIFEETQVVYYEGESVFNVLLREMKKNKIHLEYVKTPVYNSVYIEGIANLYEFDCGELSGWVYRVNNEFPKYGCSRYILSPGDKIEWLYTCDSGKDVGSRGMQKDE